MKRPQVAAVPDLSPDSQRNEAVLCTVGVVPKAGELIEIIDSLRDR
jgi:hypothetical protein